MSVYSLLPLTTTFSQYVIGLEGQHEAMRSQERGAVQPGVKPPGLVWQCTDATLLNPLTAAQPGGAWPEGRLRWDGANWKVEHDTRHRALNDGGTVKLAANLNFGGFKGVGAAAATAAGELVRFEQAALRSGVNAFTGSQSMGNNQLKDLAAPTSPNDAARLVDLNGLPIYPGWIWYQTNYDALGNGKPVVVQLESDQANTFTEAGYVPRELTIRIWGQFRKQVGNADLQGFPIEVQGWQATVRRFNADATGGDTGTDGAVLIGTITPPAPAGAYDVVDVYVEWKYAPGPLGFYLRFKARRIPGNADAGWLHLRKIGDNATRGTIQAQAQFGVGT